MTNNLTLVDFGPNSPSEVLSLITTLLSRDIISTVTTIRSPALSSTLLSSGIFPSPSSSNSLTASPSPHSALTIYPIPDTVAEYRSRIADCNAIRSFIISNPQSFVLGYSSFASHFIGDVPLPPNDKLPVSPEIVRKSAGAILLHLSELESEVSSTISSPPSSSSSSPPHTVFVIGSGGREHALAISLSLSPHVSSVVCCPGNGGTAAEGGKISNSPSTKSIDQILTLASELKPYLVVVGPEQPLVDGIVDRFNEQHPEILVFGPTAAAAQLEASKAYSKDFLQKHSIPTASYKNFTNVADAKAYVSSLPPTTRIVVKASGLAAGKGVLLPETQSEALAAVDTIMSDKSFGAAGDTCVIEEFLEGEEASCLALCDGITARFFFPAAQDHKRALDGDGGLNTGGMGAYAPAPCVTEALHKEIEDMCVKTVEKMREEEGVPYVGVLYAGMMLTRDGPKVLEFNCRFGDPETQVVLPLLESDLFEVFVACCTQKLADCDVRMKQGVSAATVVCAAKGYPESYPKGMRIVGLDGSVDDTKVYHAGTTLNDGVVRCSGGRVLAVTGMGDTLQTALGAAYSRVSQIDFLNDDDGVKTSLMHRRTDIGFRALRPKLRLGILGSTRGTSLVPILNAIADGTLYAEITCIISNRSSSGILTKALPGCHAQFISAKGLSRSEYDAKCTSLLTSHGCDYICLIGYMRILSSEFCQYWNGRCINVHPSLLPKHAGGMDLEVHQAVIDAKEPTSGCTIHEVTEEVDGGPILVQKVVNVESDDTPESLKAKVQPLEGVAFIEAIENYIRKTRGLGSPTKKLTYDDAGVSISTGNTFVERIKPFCAKTKRSGCDVVSLGGFGGFFDLSAAGFTFEDGAILVGATDGVGTKLIIAQEYSHHSTIGIDLVAMCVNDLIVTGAEPLFFLDYYATGKLEVDAAVSVVEGIAKGCELAGCGLIGGETAEMPDVYKVGDYDLAGFAVGAVHGGKKGILPKEIKEGDVLLGLTSSGVHSNGYSLVRKLVDRKEGLTYQSIAPWDESTTVGGSLLTPTKIYVKGCLPLINAGLAKGFAHITGGGLLENVPRVLPKDLVADIRSHPALPPVFRWIKEEAKLTDGEMLRTFNCGVGMVVIVGEGDVERATAMLREEYGVDEICELGVLVKREEEGGEQVVMKTQLV